MKPVKQNEKFIRMLQNPNLVHAKIAEKFGVSRQRVNQIAQELGIFGRKNQMYRRSQRELFRLKKFENISFVKDARDRRLQVEIISPKNFIVNKLRVKLLRACWHGNKRKYINIVAPGEVPEICIWQLPDSLGYLILPKNKVPVKRTMFLPHEPKTARKGGNLKRHDFRKYINAWHIL